MHKPARPPEEGKNYSRLQSGLSPFPEVWPVPVDGCGKSLGETLFYYWHIYAHFPLQLISKTIFGDFQIVPCL